MNRYDKTIQKTSTNVSYIKGRFYPNIPPTEDDFYIITTVGDRLDYLAYRYYGDSELWWVISSANNNITNGFLFPIPGTQLRIPSDISSVLEQVEQFNQSR